MRDRHFRDTVVGIDGSDRALQAARWAAGESALRGCGLRLATVIPRMSGDPGGTQSEREHLDEVLTMQANSRLDAAATDVARVVTGLRIERSVVVGSAAATLAEQSRHADLMVVGNRGRGGFSGLLGGSVSIALAVAARCPLVVARGIAPAHAPVVVGVDGSAHGAAALAFAFGAAAARRVPLVAVRAWSDVCVDPYMIPMVDWDAVRIAEEDTLDRDLCGWREKLPEVEIRTRSVRDRPARALIDESSAAQLVVVGSRGRGAAAGSLLGSVSRALVNHSHCPVAVVRAPPTMG